MPGSGTGTPAGGFVYDLTTNVGKVRLEVGDTVLNSGVFPGGTNLTDAEVNRYLTLENNNIYAAAAAICRMLAGRWAREASRQLGDYRISYSDVARSYREQAAELSKLAQRGVLFAGGISQARKDSLEDDTDRIPPAFTRALDLANTNLAEDDDDG